MSPSSANRNRWTRNVALIGWIISMFGIFWGIWWSFVVLEVLTATKPEMTGLAAYLPRGVYACIIALYAGIFTDGFVRWLDRISGFSPRTTAWRLIGAQGVALGHLGGFVMITAAMTALFNLGWSQFAYGTTVTLLWFAVSILAATRPRQ